MIIGTKAFYLTVLTGEILAATKFWCGHESGFMVHQMTEST